MKAHVLALIAIAALGVNSSIVDTDEELICINPENPHDCYPRLFVPTTEWQTIKEGQDIPPGLHVRLNIDTLTREAKIMDPSEEDDVSQEVVVVESSHPQDEEIEEQENLQHQVDEFQKNQIHQKIQEFKGKERAKRINGEDLNNYQGAVDEVEQYDGDTTRLNQALNTLDDLSHDLEFGVKLTASDSVFVNFQRIVDSTSDSAIHEKIYRIMASALRNNPEAVTNVLNNLSGDYVVEWFSQVSNKATPDIVQKRILGVIQALAQNNHFNLKYFNLAHDTSSSGITLLVKNFSNLGEQAKSRLVSLFEDIQLVTIDTNSKDRRSVENSQNPDYQVSQFLQESLAQQKVTSPEQFKVFFNSLGELHTQDKSLKPSSDFLNWLAKEVEERKHNKKRDDYSEEDKAFDAQMLRARHEIFGNPMGHRKAIADEL